ncbi:helix-turn-helix domain-containing protein [Plantibacter sp. RU18]|uniref:helix-turn-helix domain-containing protein n=1 Tax=Plantibacter sp. RU18 TaxID=3158143 RepID=UPI003D36CC1F
MDAAGRWRVLRLHVEDQIPLAVLARGTGISARTLQRWNHVYRAGGIAALDPHARIDKGVRRTSVETVAFIEQLALHNPDQSFPGAGNRGGGERWSTRYRTTALCPRSVQSGGCRRLLGVVGSLRVRPETSGESYALL